MGPIKPSDEAAGLNKGAGLGCVNVAGRKNDGLQRNDVKLDPNSKSGVHMDLADVGYKSGPVPLRFNEVGSNEFDGLKLGDGADVGSALIGPRLLDADNVSPSRVDGLGWSHVGPSSCGLNVEPVNILKFKNPMTSMVDNLREKDKGSGFFDVSKNTFGPRKSPNLEVKNTFDALQNEEDCFDTEHELWEKDMLMVRKF
ncbi:hypothetical protein Hanom_Chr08g00714001 [Helianthus anomalus]